MTQGRHLFLSFLARFKKKKKSDLNKEENENMRSFFEIISS